MSQKECAEVNERQRERMSTYFIHIRHLETSHLLTSLLNLWARNTARKRRHTVRIEGEGEEGIVLTVSHVDTLNIPLAHVAIKLVGAVEHSRREARVRLEGEEKGGKE